MEIRKNNPLKDLPNLLKKKTKRPIILPDIESENDSMPKDAESEFDNINLNFDKYCYICHKEVIKALEEHTFFRCKTCCKYYHRDCYKEFSLKKIEKDLLKDVTIANKIHFPSPKAVVSAPPAEGTESNPPENSAQKAQNNISYQKREFFGKECIICIMQNSNFCYICKKKIDYEKELIIRCELCGNLMHYKCLDVPLYFIFYRELYKNYFSNNNIDSQKYKEFLLKLKEFNNNEITKDTLQSIFEQIPIKIDPNFYQNLLFYVCNYCKTRNLFDLQEINVYRSTSFSKVNYYNTALNPLSQNIHKVKDSWNMNKIHEMYISSSNPYNDAKFDMEKYDSIYATPKPIKIIKKYRYNRINNIIIKNNVDINNNNNEEVMSLNNPNENEDSGSIVNSANKKDENNNENNNNDNNHNNNNDNPKGEKKDENNNENNKPSSPEEEDIYELTNIVQMFEDGEKNKQNDNNKNKEQTDNNNKMVIDNENDNTVDNNLNQNKEINQYKLISDNINSNGGEKEEEKIVLPERCLYLIKWDTLEFSLELDSFMECFQDFDKLVSDFNMKTSEEKNNYQNYPSEEVFLDKIKKILSSLGINEDSEYYNLIYNSFIYKKKDEIMAYKTKIISIIKKLFSNINHFNFNFNFTDSNSDHPEGEDAVYMPHILILCDNFGNNIAKLLENMDINYLDLFNNKHSFFYECLNFKEGLALPKNKNELNVITINNNIYPNKNRDDILEVDSKNKYYVIPNILVDNINSINFAYLQDFHFDMIIFDLNNSKSISMIREFFKKITNPLNTNYKSLIYFLVEQQDTSKKEKEKANNNTNNNSDPNSNDGNKFVINSNILNIQKTLLKFFDLFYYKEETILLYGNYSGINKNNPILKSDDNNNNTNSNNHNNNHNTNNNNTLNESYSSDEKESLKITGLIPNNNIEKEYGIDIDLFFYKKNFINLNFSTLNYNELFNGLIINRMKWSLNLDKSKFHYTQILSSLITKYESKIFSLRNNDFNQIIMNFIPISLDKETFIQYLYIIKNKPEILLKTQENKKDLMQNILLLCSLPCCMTKYYKKYLEDYKVPIKDNVNMSKIDMFYQLSRLLLYKTKGKIIVLFPLHDKVYRENDSLLRKIRKEIEKVFFSNVNPSDKDINLEERKRNFNCFLMDEEGLFEEIASSANSPYPTHIIIFNMFLQNKNTGELFNNIIKSKVRHKIIMYQLYINNLIEGKLSQVFYSKLNQFIEICSSPLRKMKTTVYGQLTLAEKEIITISGLKKTYETELSNNNLNDTYTKNDLSKLNVITSYKNLFENEKCFDGFIYIKKNSYLICTNSNGINLRFDNIYNSFIGNVSFNNYDNTLMNNSYNNNNMSANNIHNNPNIIIDDDVIGNANNNIQNYNYILNEYKKKKFYQELDFLKDESNFDKLKTNKYDLTGGNKNDNPNQNANGNNPNNNNNQNENMIENNNNNANNNINENTSNAPHTRGEEILVLNDSSDNLNGLMGENNANGQPKKRRGRRKKVQPNSNGINLGINNNVNNNNSNNEPIQIANDEDNDEINSFLSDDMRSITNNMNNNNNDNNNNNNNGNNVNSNNNNDMNSNNANSNNLNALNEDSLGDINNNQNDNNNLDHVPVNLDEITEDYSDTITENMESPNENQNNENGDNNQNQDIDSQNQQNNELANGIENNDGNNQNQQNIDGANLNENNINKDSTNNNEERINDIIKNIATTILKNKPGNNIQNNDIENENINSELQNRIIENNDIQEIEPIEKLVNETKFESSRDRLFKIYNYLLSRGFEEKTRKLFVRCLLNYGFPLYNEFNKFYILFTMNAKHLNIKNIPNKIDTQFYYELVYFVLEEDEYLDYNIFVFGEERTSLIRTKLLIIRQFQSFRDVSKYMYHYVKEKGHILFHHIEPKLDESYQRVHFVMAKILSNLISKSIKSGFLNYKNYIKDDDVIFDNIRIKKDGQTSVFNIREGISKKIFGKTLNEKEFNNTVELYYKALFTQQIKLPDELVNNNDNAIR